MEQRIAAGDEKAKLVYDAMLYGAAKSLGALAAAADGQVDRIILTGGIAHSKYVADYLTKKLSFIAPVEVMAGEFEMEALAAGACRVLAGEEKPHAFSELESGDVSQLPNPVHESTAEEVAEKTGITLNVPITAVDVTYSYIDGDSPLAQVSFVYQGQTYTYRGQKTQTVQDISGMYYEWTKTTNDSEDVPYTCYFTDEGQGMALWHTDGVSYTLGMTENVTEELLVTMYGIVTGEAE